MDGETVIDEVRQQAASLSRVGPLTTALQRDSAIIIGSSIEELIPLANEFAAEHVNLQTRDDAAVLTKLRHGGVKESPRRCPPFGLARPRGGR